MRYIAILQTVKDLTDPTPLQQELPDEYPVNCVEIIGVDSLESAKAIYPDKQVMTVDEYNSGRADLDSIASQAQAAADLAAQTQTPQPKVAWWKFWA